MCKFVNRFLSGSKVKVQKVLSKDKEILQSQRGEGFIDTAVKILISVVLGGLLLAGLYLLFKDTVLPSLSQKIIGMFNYKGN